MLINPHCTLYMITKKGFLVLVYLLPYQTMDLRQNIIEKRIMKAQNKWRVLGTTQKSPLDK